MEIIRKRFDLPPIGTEGQIYKKTFELDNNSRRLLGILVTSDLDNLLFSRGTIGLELNGHELTPEDFHAKHLMSGLGVRPDHRYLSLDLNVGNLQMKATFKDNAHPTVSYSAYNVSIYCLIEIDHAND